MKLNFRKKFNLHYVFIRALSIYCRNFPLMVLLGAMATVLINVYVYMFNLDSILGLDGHAARHSFVGIAGGILAVTGLIIFTCKIEAGYQRKKLTMAQTLYLIRTRFIRVAVAGLLYFSLFLAGLVLLILPGIYLGILFVFVSTAAVLEDNAVGPFKYAKEIIRGHFWTIFLTITGAYFLYLLSNAVIGLILGIAGINGKLPLTVAIVVYSVFAWPLLHAVIVVSYLELRRLNKGKIDMNAVRGNGKLGCLIAVIIYLVLFACLTGLVLFGNKAGGVSSWLHKLASTDSFPDGIRLKESGNWSPAPYLLSKDTYTLQNRKTRLLLVSVNCFTAAGIAEIQDNKEQAFKLNDIMVKKYDKDPLRKIMKFGNFNFAGLTVLKTGDIKWNKLEYYDCRRFKDGVYTLKWVSLYTLYGKDCLVVDYAYKFPGQFNKKNMPSPPDYILSDESDLAAYMAGIVIPGVTKMETGSNAADAKSYYENGILQTRFGNNQGAVESFSKAIDIDPKNYKAVCAEGLRTGG